MTDELSPEQEAAVQRLLSEARHDEPIPADVAARLDQTLAGLVAGDAAPEPVGAGPASVTDLDGVRRRRRNAGRLLLAAAAVVVGGVAVGQTVGQTSMSDSDGGSADSSLAEPPRDSAGGEDETAAGGGASNEDEDPAELGSAPAPAAGDLDGQTLRDSLSAPLKLTSESFAVSVQAELSADSTLRRAAARSNLDGLSTFAYDATTDSEFVCPEADYGPGAKLPAYYDEEEAVLVLRRPQAGLQRVDLLACGTAALLDSVDLPAR